MSVTCLNCGTVFEGQFCPACGQKADVKRLTWKTLIGEILHFVTHLEHGFLFTTLRFITRPGVTGLAYIEGRRQKYQKPVSYFLIWTGLYILMHNAIIHFHHFELEGGPASDLSLQAQGNLLFREHLTLFLIPVIGLSAFLIYVLMGRPRYNFVEILTLSLYGAGTYFMMSLVTDSLLGWLLGINILSATVFLWQLTLSTVYNFWFTYDFFKRLSLRHFRVRLILTSMAVAAGGWVIMFYLPMAWIMLTR